MKKKFLKMLGLFLLMTILFSGLGVMYPEEYYAFERETGIPPRVQAQMDLQQGALHTYETLYANMQSQAVPMSVSENSLTPSYDNDYAGEYIEGDRLVLLLVDRDEQTEAKYRALCEDSPYIRFADAKYSLNQLNSYKSNIDAMVTSYDIVSYGVDIKANQYHIGITEEDYDAFMQEPLIQENPDIFSVTVEERAKDCAASLYGGDAISNTFLSQNSKSSICIGGTYQGKDCILTCGHGKSVSDIIYRGTTSTAIGSVVYKRANTNAMASGVSKLGDFAIVQLNSNYTGTNKVRNATTLLNIKGVYSSVPVGTTIYKYGSTTGYTSGNVTAVSQSVSYGKTTLRYYTDGLTLSTVANPIDGGDSGGCVYIKDGSVYKISGNITAKSGTYSMYHTPIYYAQNAGFSPDVS